MSDLMINKVAASGLLTLDLERFVPPAQQSTLFDLKDHLFMGLILKEKDFREGMKNFDWQPYADKHVAVTCTVDAVIPVWAYMLLTSYLQPIARDVYIGTAEDLHKHLLLRNIEAVDVEVFRDQRVVVKGCGEIAIEPYAYAAITKVLLPVVKSIMYGEPCSTVPVYKKR
ncbi:MAG: DUF2480 family protein [Chitinophagaceae bacterium]